MKLNLIVKVTQNCEKAIRNSRFAIVDFQVGFGVMNVTSFHRPCTVHGARCTMHGAINKRNPMEAIRSLILFCFLASAVCAHLGKDVVAKSSLFPHPAEVQIMDESFPSNPSYVIVQFSMNIYTCAAANVLAYYSYVLNTCVTSNSSSSSSIITCRK